MSLLTKLKQLQELNVKLNIPENNILRKTYYSNAINFIHDLENGRENIQITFFSSHYQSLMIQYLEQHNEINSLRYLLDTNSEDTNDLREIFANRIAINKGKISNTKLKTQINKKIEEIDKAFSNSKFKELSCYDELKKILEQFKKYYHGDSSDIYFSANFAERIFEYVEREASQIHISLEDLPDTSISSSTRSSHINHFRHCNKHDQKNLDEAIVKIKLFLNKIKENEELSGLYQHYLHVLELYEQRGEEFNTRNFSNDVAYFRTMLSNLEEQASPYLPQEEPEQASTNRLNYLLNSIRGNIGAIFENTVSSLAHFSNSILNHLFTRNEARVIPHSEPEISNRSENDEAWRISERSSNHENLQLFSGLILDQEFVAPSTHFIGGSPSIDVIQY